MFLLWTVVVFAYSIFQGIRGDSVSQKEALVTILEGQSVVLPCSYETSEYAPVLLWYEQRPFGAPQLLISNYDGQDEETMKHRKGFRYSEEKKKSFNLTKESTELKDTAIYFCALRGTVRRAMRRA
ncbi:hypothetical protein JRQ81_004363 [Phrynocephalus forsythii]|uniref:Ig-like domain-containing protein n=1 Tax=Phrynocephalus forsythii TaxID=171643 RepID=A0A9Q1AUU4_9SAUR|nr:hypothetical protein JRQ81_004363 [Phrynocephalus forsythii]